MPKPTLDLKVLKKHAVLREQLLGLLKISKRTKDQEREIQTLRIRLSKLPHDALVWVVEAQGLIGAAECLRKVVYINDEKLRYDKVIRAQQRRANHKAGVMLLSLALENSLKAALIAVNGIDFDDLKQTEHFHTHNLRLLYDYLKTTGYAPKINIARLDEAQRSIEWAGKYLIPKRPQQYGDVITFESRREIVRFMKRLWELVFDIDDLIYAN